ncbi:unnamed protein product [Sympodiomycopsis kandeliae]
MCSQVACYAAQLSIPFIMDMYFVIYSEGENARRSDIAETTDKREQSRIAPSGDETAEPARLTRSEQLAAKIVDPSTFLAFLHYQLPTLRNSDLQTARVSKRSGPACGESPA